MTIFTYTKMYLSNLYQTKIGYLQNKSLRCLMDISTFPLLNKLVDTRMRMLEVLLSINNKPVQVSKAQIRISQSFFKFQRWVITPKAKSTCPSFNKARSNCRVQATLQFLSLQRCKSATCNLIWKVNSSSRLNVSGKIFCITMRWEWKIISDHHLQKKYGKVSTATNIGWVSIVKRILVITKNQALCLIHRREGQPQRCSII
jgi:hypothetical protein